MDITDRKAAEENLRRSEERLRIAKTAAKLGVHDYDMRSGVIEWDERTRELWGVDPEVRITYETFESGLHPGDRSHVRETLDKALDPSGRGL